MAFRVTWAAQEQIDALLLRSARNFGLEAARRYGDLIQTVLAALGDDPHRIGSVEISRVPGVLAYPIRHLRQRIDPAHRVGNPRHLIIYRPRIDDVTEILGLVHDRMVLSRAARSILRTTYDS